MLCTCDESRVRSEGSSETRRAIPAPVFEVVVRVLTSVSECKHGVAPRDCDVADRLLTLCIPSCGMNAGTG